MSSFASPQLANASNGWGHHNLSATVEAYQDEEPMTVGEALEAVFRKYATFGRSKLQAEREQDYLSSSSLLKLMKDCHLIDRALTITDLDLIFTRCLPQKYHKRLDMEHFQEALYDIAVQRQMPLEDLLAIVAKARPSNNGGTIPDSYVKFHDDRTTWTGVATRGGPTIHDKHQHAHFGLSSIWDRDPNHDVRGVKPHLYQGEQQYSYHYRPSAFEDKSPNIQNRLDDDDRTQMQSLLRWDRSGAIPNGRSDSVGHESTVQPAAHSAYLKVLTDYFAKHNPIKIDSAASLLAKYAGREMDLFDKIYEKYGEPVLPLQAYAYNNAAAPLQNHQGPLPFNPLPTERQKHFTSPNSINSALGVGVAGGSMGSLSPSKSPSVSPQRGQPSIFNKLQDHTQYTGAHKHRFDHSGKGRGLGGRDVQIVGVGTHAVGRADFKYGVPTASKPEYTGNTNQGTNIIYADASEFLVRR